MEYSVTALSLNIDGPVSPNWFGVWYRKSIQSFDSVNIFVHPSPGHAGMKDDTYQSQQYPGHARVAYGDSVYVGKAIRDSESAVRATAHTACQRRVVA